MLLVTDRSPPMNLIEMLFGIAPDGGNGSLEFTTFAVLFLLAFLTFRRRKTAKKDCVTAV